jgi:hypothetical protein
MENKKVYLHTVMGQEQITGGGQRKRLHSHMAMLYLRNQNHIQVSLDFSTRVNEAVIVTEINTNPAFNVYLRRSNESQDIHALQRFANPYGKDLRSVAFQNVAGGFGWWIAKGFFDRPSDFSRLRQKNEYHEHGEWAHELD